MFKLKQNIAELFKVKSLMSLGIMGALIYGFVDKIITGEQFMMVATAIITFYFAKPSKDKVE